jgi:AcrR family transcriptional regulator
MASGSTTTPARGERRAALVAVAADMFGRKPYQDIYISDIAKEAGVAHGLLFYHFKDKRGLYLAAMQQVLDDIMKLHEPADGEDTKEKWLRGVLHRQIEYRRDNVHTTLALMRAGGQDKEVDELFEQARRAAVDFMCELLGIPGTPPPELRMAVRGCMGCVDEMTIDWLTHDRDVEMEELERLGYAAVLAVLSSVCSGQPELGEIMHELSVSA